MSLDSLYRVFVRMLHDPELARSVYADPEAALAAEPLTATERSWLTQPDRRAWRTDPQRASRVLSTLVEELPVSCAFVLRGGCEGVVRPRLERLEGFFSNAFFHDAVRRDGLLVDAFGAYLALPEHLGVPADPRSELMVRIERAVARVRRQPPPTPGPDPSRLVLNPRVALVEAPGQTLRLYDRVSRALATRGEDVRRVLLDPRWSLPVLLDPDPDEPEHIIVEARGRRGAAAAIEVGTVGAPLAALLGQAAHPVERASLCRWIQENEPGTSTSEAEEIVSDRVAEGLLLLS